MKYILAYSAEKQGKFALFKCSDGETLLTNSWFDAISFILKPCDMAVTWNVEHFADAFISLITKSKAKELNDNGKVFLENGEKVYYQIGRVFAVTYGRETNVYPLHKYSDKEITDVKELEILGYKVLEAYKVFGIEPTKLTSPVSVYSLDNIDYPRACDLPESAYSMLNRCDITKWIEWREVFKLGHWNANEVLDYDLQSAYPSLIARLPDLRGAKFFKTEEMPDDSEYSWGELEGVLRITKDVTPFGYIGEQEAQITTEHLWAINKYDWGSFKFKHGYFFKLPQTYRLPFREIMQNLYQKRCSSNPMVSKIAKAISVGIGGKFAQRYENGRLGDDYQSIYSRMITSRCSIKVADFVWRNGISKDVIAILVDGILTENNGVNIELGNGGIGSWRVNDPSPFIVASLLYQWGGTKHPNAETYDEIMDHIKANPNSSIIGKDVDLNLLTHGRIFEDRPRTGRELLSKYYTSTPNMV
jgi:hypothetical protein